MSYVDILVNEYDRSNSMTVNITHDPLYIQGVTKVLSSFMKILLNITEYYATLIIDFSTQ